MKVTRRGTHRVMTPEATLARIGPLRDALGVTRCAPVTGLDRIGIPVFAAARPLGTTLTVSAGKGVTPAHAEVSALMEAAELHHAEKAAPLHHRARDSARSLGAEAVEVTRLQGYRHDRHWSEALELEWCPARELYGGRLVWVPTCSVYVCRRRLVDWTTNGLASGNDHVEATLHALYEVIERDAVARLADGGKLRIRERCRGIDLDSIEDETVRSLCESIVSAGLTLRLLSVPHATGVPTLWAVLLDDAAPRGPTRVNMGFGSHLSPVVAACRAITEAAQTRLTFIHGARNDLLEASYDPSPRIERARRFFEGFPGEALFREYEDHSSDRLDEDLRVLVERLTPAPIYVTDLTDETLGIPVVKVQIPDTRIDYRLF